MQILDELLGRPGRTFAYGYLSQLVRYVSIAGGAYLLFYILLHSRIAWRKIQPRPPRLSQLQREIAYSLLSLSVFAATGVVVLAGVRSGWMHIYLDVHRYGWGYLWMSLVVLVLLHDTWFYWTHRLMHWRPLFRVMHHVHHRSHSPTPWAAFAFHPTEAIVQAMIFPLVVLFMPVHPMVAGMWLLYMTLMNVGGHLGYEVLPRGFTRNWLTAWHNTTTHHDMHHRYVRCNYSLYFNLWDRLMGTNHPAV